MLDKLIRIKDPKTNKIGFKSRVGNVIVPCVYDTVGKCWCNGLIFVKRVGWQGFLDENADEVIELRSYSIEANGIPSFHKGFCLLKNQTGSNQASFKCIDTQGRNIFGSKIYSECRFIDDLSDTIIYAENSHEKSLYSIRGKILDISQYSIVDNTVNNALLAVSIEGKYGLQQWGCIDLRGNVRIPLDYSSIRYASRNFFVVEKYGKFGIIDSMARQITPLIYEKVRSYNGSDLCAVMKNNLWGFVDIRGKVSISMIYNDVRDFYSGKVFVKNGNKWHVIDQQGNQLPGCEFDDVTEFAEGMCAVKSGNKWGFINSSYVNVIPCSFAEVESFVGDRCRVKRSGAVRKYDDPWGYIDVTGKVIVPWIDGGERRSTERRETFSKVEKIFYVLFRLLRP